MVDVDRRMAGLNPAHVAGLRRLSARATPHHRKLPSAASISHSSPTKKFITRLCTSGVTFSRVLTDTLSSGSDLEHYFEHKSLLWGSDPEYIRSYFDRRSIDSLQIFKTPRWEENCVGAAVDLRRRDCSSPERLGLPQWVEEYILEIGSVLREGGWPESDVSEIIHVPACGIFDGRDSMMMDCQAILDGLLLKADRLSNTLQMAGWSSEDVAEMVEFRVRG